MLSAKVKGFKDLLVCQKAVDLADVVYEYTENFPTKEMYGLSSQMRRCSVSIASNIAEGNARNGTKELLHFLSIAKGSLAELETQMIIANRRKFLTEDIFLKVSDNIRELDYLVFNLMQKLKTRL